MKSSAIIIENNDIDDNDEMGASMRRAKARVIREMALVMIGEIFHRGLATIRRYKLVVLYAAARSCNRAMSIFSARGGLS